MSIKGPIYDPKRNVSNRHTPVWQYPNKRLRYILDRLPKTSIKSERTAQPIGRLRPRCANHWLQLHRSHLFPSQPYVASRREVYYPEARVQKMRYLLPLFGGIERARSRCRVRCPLLLLLLLQHASDSIFLNATTFLSRVPAWSLLRCEDETCCCKRGATAVYLTITYG